MIHATLKFRSAPMKSKPSLARRSSDSFSIVWLFSWTGIFALTIFGCVSGPVATKATDSSNMSRKIASLATENPDFVILQLNDVYEIKSYHPYGGLARASTFLKNLKKQFGKNKVMSILAGDFISPSALGGSKINGEALNGKQMISTLNIMGLDLATFGNHEFDYKYKLILLNRIRESKFAWISSNVRQLPSEEPFPKVPKYLLKEVEVANNASIKIGFFGLTIDSNKKSYVTYDDYIGAATEQVQVLRDQEKVDFVVAVTHLDIADDRQLAMNVPGIDLIIGGHEHEHIIERVHNSQTKREVTITKADENANSLYAHYLKYRPATKTVELTSHLIPMNKDIAEDEAIVAEATQWYNHVFAEFRKRGIDPKEQIATTLESLDGRSMNIRNHPTNLSIKVPQSMLMRFPEAQFAVFNAGDMRIDGTIDPGPITNWDLIRMLPWGGHVCKIKVKGSTLIKLHAFGQRKRMTGDYLVWIKPHTSAENALKELEPSEFTPNSDYELAITDYLLSGEIKGLEILGKQEDLIERDKCTKGYPDAHGKNKIENETWSVLKSFLRVVAPPR